MIRYSPLPASKNDPVISKNCNQDRPAASFKAFPMPIKRHPRRKLFQYILNHLMKLAIYFTHTLIAISIAPRTIANMAKIKPMFSSTIFLFSNFYPLFKLASIVQYYYMETHLTSKKELYVLYL